MHNKNIQIWPILSKYKTNISYRIFMQNKIKKEKCVSMHFEL